MSDEVTQGAVLANERDRKIRDAIEDLLDEFKNVQATGIVADEIWNRIVGPALVGNPTVAEFCAERAEYINSINNCGPDNDRDYWRWNGHAEARRQLSERLGLPTAWPAEVSQ